MARSVYDLRSTPLRSTPAAAAAGEALPYAPGCAPRPVRGVAPAAAVDTHAVPIDLLAERMALRARA